MCTLLSEEGSLCIRVGPHTGVWGMHPWIKLTFLSSDSHQWLLTQGWDFVTSLPSILGFYVQLPCYMWKILFPCSRHHLCLLSFVLSLEIITYEPWEDGVIKITALWLSTLHWTFSLCFVLFEGVLPACMYVCALSMPGVCRGQRRAWDLQTPDLESGITDGCELPCRCRELNRCLLDCS